MLIMLRVMMCDSCQAYQKHLTIGDPSKPPQQENYENRGQAAVTDPRHDERVVIQTQSRDNGRSLASDQHA